MSRVESILQPAEKELLEMVELKGKGVVELGNKKNPNGLYREWYTHRGASYLCLDINGEDGAFPIDFRKPISLAPGDIVTNIGFTEHVGPLWVHQVQCWKNVHSLVKHGGTLVCVTPRPRAWEKHGMWQPHLEFYREFAIANGYTVRLLDDDRGVHSKPVVRAVLELSDPGEFVWKPVWKVHFWRTPITENY
jgi:hypothetical protein